jgi:hypothetical protein
VALVIDPRPDIDRVLTLAAARGVRVTHAFETQLHNDYLTGGLALARAARAAYHVNAADRWPSTGRRFATGTVIGVSPVTQTQAIATPGHTFTHLSYMQAARRPLLSQTPEQVAQAQRELGLQPGFGVAGQRGTAGPPAARPDEFRPAWCPRRAQFA